MITRSNNNKNNHWKKSWPSSNHSLPQIPYHGQIINHSHALQSRGFRAVPPASAVTIHQLLSAELLQLKSHNIFILYSRASRPHHDLQPPRPTFLAPLFIPPLLLPYSYPPCHHTLANRYGPHYLYRFINSIAHALNNLVMDRAQTRRFSDPLYQHQGRLFSRRAQWWRIKCYKKHRWRWL